MTAPSLCWTPEAASPQPKRPTVVTNPPAWVTTETGSDEGEVPDPPWANPDLQTRDRVTLPPTNDATDTPFSDYPTPELTRCERLSQFGRAQLEDPNLPNVWRAVSVIECSRDRSCPLAPSIKYRAGCCIRYVTYHRGRSASSLSLGPMYL